MNLRPYQREAIGKTMASLLEYDRVLGVAATGAGKTILASELMRLHGDTRCLFLADAQTLVTQAADKHAQHTGEHASVEMGESDAMPGDRCVVATVQSLARRLEKWSRDYFGLVIVDEAHRNTLGAQSQKVLGHFNSAQVVGITATPYRSDKKQLGSYYQTVAFEIPLDRLIGEGHLARITIKSVPLDVDLRAVRSAGGDYREDDLGAALEPHLRKAAELLKEHASDRKTVVFLPLIDTSKRFAAICREIGLRAVHVDGTDRAALAEDWQVVCNSALLTTGWDEPSVSCVYILRPTKSHALYSQMVGRGTRNAPGKKNLLLLDPLWLSDRLDLIRPARLLAHTEEEAKSIQEALDLDGDADLLAARDKADADRRKSLLEKMQRNARKQARTIDAMELAVSLNEAVLLDYEPEFQWEEQPMTTKQREILERNGLDLTTVSCKGHATKIIDVIFKRRTAGLATFKQVKWLIKLRHPNPNTATFEEASAAMEKAFGKKKEKAA